MAYYRGDYYMGARGRFAGDYYRGGGRGDPFWGALWTGIKAVGGALLGVRPASTATPGVVQTGPTMGQQAIARISSGLTGALVPQGLGQGSLQPNATLQRATNLPPFPAGPISSRRVTMPMVQLPDGSFAMRRRRRMNPANPRALRRSIRRVVGFGRLAMRSRKAVAKAATALQCNRPRAARVARRR